MKYLNFSKNLLSEILFEKLQNEIKINNIQIEITKEEIFQTLERPPELSFGDFAFPCFKFAKKFGKNPNEFAKSLKESIENDPQIKSVEQKGAFLNFFLNQAVISKYLIPEIIEGNFFNQLKLTNQSEKIMVEYSQPNTHKEFHVGHGRNVCLGDSLVRLLRYTGQEVIPVNYIGDEGTHVAKCLWGLKNYANQNELLAVKNKAEWLGNRYVEANTLLKNANEEEKLKYNLEISEILKSIESKSGADFELWQTTRKYCLTDFNTIYNWLNVEFENFFYESEVSESSQAIVDEYLQKGLFKYDQGAVGLDMSEEKLGFFMARKSDGTTLYGTKDLALAKIKFNDFKIDKSIYVVANEQNFHFKQVFNALVKMGFEKAIHCYHLSYGMVVRPDGKMSSRLGNSFTFFQLIEIVTSEINLHLEKYKNVWSEELILQTAKNLSVGAIKYGMLQADPLKEIVFDPKEWVSFEGNSGPYLMYSYARTKSILEKAKELNLNYNLLHLNLLTHETERELLKFLNDFNQTISYATQNYRPSTVCTHLFSMCKSFGRFYSEVSVLKAESNDLISARLALVLSFSKVLKTGLNLIGIEPPEKM